MMTWSLGYQFLQERILRTIRGSGLLVLAVVVLWIVGQLVHLEMIREVTAQDSSEVYQRVYNGWKWWHVYCYRCHGVDAIGTTLAPNLIDPNRKLAPEEFLPVVRNGLPQKGMPAWNQLLDDKQITEIYIYVRARTENLLPRGRPDEIGPNGGPWHPPAGWVTSVPTSAAKPPEAVSSAPTSEGISSLQGKPKLSEVVSHNPQSLGAAASGLKHAAFYEPPQLFVMTGFIANTTSGTWGSDFIVAGRWTPEKQRAALNRWNQGLGSHYDADKTLQAFKEAGATGIIFYDKWHDGLVAHDTKLTAFKTERDLLGLTLRAARKYGLKTVVYYSVGLDYNPEARFQDWTCRDRSNKPLGLAFPTDWKSFYSPYRQYVIDHLVEILKNYGPLDGLWLDLYTQPTLSHDPYTVKAFKDRYRKPLEQASATERVDFGTQTLRNFLLEIRKAISAIQPNIELTFNGAGMGDVVQPLSAQRVESLVDWFSMEGHRWSTIDRIARVGHNMDRPFEVGMLLNSSWYVPMDEQAPPAAMSEDEAIVSAATAWTQGSNIFAAMTPGHSGVFDEQGDLRLLRAVGNWLTKNRSWLRDAVPYADAGILLGNPSPELPQIPSIGELWQNSGDSDVLAVAAGLHRMPSRPGESLDLELRQIGYFPNFIGSAFAGRAAELKSYRLLLLPENALLDEETVQNVREYVRAGGMLLSFGHATLLDEMARSRANFALSDVLGVNLAGSLPGYKQLELRPESGLVSSLKLNPGALSVKVTSGKVLADWRGAGHTPAIVENFFGKGRSIYVSADETALEPASKLLNELTGRLIGPPSVKIESRRSYSLVMNRQGHDLLLCLLNRSTGSRAYSESGFAPDLTALSTPESLSLTVNTSILGEISRVELLPDGKPVPISRQVGVVRALLDASPSVTTVRLMLR